MVVRRRRVVMGLVAVAALALSVGYLWRFGDDHSIVPFLLAGALMVVAVMHGITWRESANPLLVVDMTGLRVRLGGDWALLPWGEVERVEVAGRGRVGDGRLVIRSRDERRALADGGLRCRFAVLLNRWLYDAALVVPHGITTTVSVEDIPGSLRRLADGRAAVVVLEERALEPHPTVEVTSAADAADEASQAPADRADADDADDADDAVAAADPDHPAGPAGPAGKTVPSRRLAGVVSALRSPGSRRESAIVPVRPEPATAGMLALSDHLGQETEPLPELHELRRRAPEDADRDGGGDRPPQTSNVELVIDATTDLSARAMHRVRQEPAPLDPSEEPAWEQPPPQPQAAGELAAVGPLASQHAEPDEPVSTDLAIGAEIRAAREWLGISIDDLAERTRIRPFVIESIEVDDFAPCGGDFYARGHLRMLAGVLGVDPTPLLASYDEQVAIAPVSPRAVFDAELSRGVLRPTGGGSRWGALIATVLVLILVWGVARFFLSDPGHGAGRPSLPSSSSSVLGSPRITDPAIAGTAIGGTAIGGTAIAPPAPTHLTVSASGGSSRVVVWNRSGAVIYQGILQPGQTARVTGQGPVRVMAVDGGVVSLSGPGHPAAPMGSAGQRVFLHLR